MFLATFARAIQDEHLFQDSMRNIASTAPDWKISIADVASTLYNPDSGHLDQPLALCTQNS